MNNFKLCYVKLPWVYFTTQELDKQWGDDWNDAPYEHNAGEPYAPGYHHYMDERGSVPNEKDWNKDRTPKWEIKKIIIEGDYILEPCSRSINTPYSVEQINKGACPWLVVNAYGDPTYVQAGTSFEDFLDICKENDVDVYIKYEEQ